MEEELLNEVKGLLEEGNPSEVIRVIDENKKNIKTKYHDFNIIYIEALLDLDNVQKAKEMIEEELNMPYIPMEYEDQYRELYNDIMFIEKEAELKNIDFSDDEIREVLNSRPLKEEAALIAFKLNDKNVRSFLPEIKELMKDIEVPNIYKFLILSVLNNQEVSEKIEFISKYGTDMVCAIDKANDDSQGNIEKCFELLNETSKDVTLIDNAKKILMGMAVAMYPITIEEDDVVDFSATAYYKSSKMLGNDISKSVLLEKFNNVNLDKVDYFESVEVE